MTTVGEISVRVSADLAPLRKAQAEAKKVMGDLDKALNNSAKTVGGAFGATWNAQVGQFSAGASQVTGNLGKVGEGFKKTGNEAKNATKPVGQYNQFIKDSGQFSQQAAFQFNDLFVQLASGQSAFTAITQQGAQLSQMFAPGTGIGAAAKSTGAAFATFLINPLNLAVVGIAAVAAAIPSIWGAVTGNANAEKAKMALENFNALIKEIGESSTVTAEKIEKMLDTPRSWAQIQANAKQSASVIQKELTKSIEDLQDKTTKLGTVLIDTFAGVERIDVLSTFNKSTQTAVERVREIGKELSANPQRARALADEIAKIQLNPNIDESYRKALSAIQTEIEGVIKSLDTLGANKAIQNVQPQVQAAAIAFNDLQNAIDKVDNKNLKQRLSDLATQLKNGQISSDQFKTAVTGLSNATFNNAGIIRPLQGVIDAAINASKALAVVKGGRIPTAEQKGGGVVPLTDEQFDARFEGNSNRIQALDELRDKLLQTSKDLQQAGTPKKAAGNKGESDRDFIAKLQSETTFLQQQLDILGKSYDERVRLTDQLKLEKDIRDAIIRLGEKATPAQKAAVEEQIRLQQQLNAEIQKQEAINKVTSDAQIEAAGLIGSAINGAITGSKDLKSAMLDVAIAIAKAALQAQLLQSFSNGKGGLSIGGSILSAFFGGLAGARAKGGPVSQGSSYLVGEEGPEIFTANRSGVIIPNNKLGSGSIGGNSNSTSTTSDVRVWVDDDGNWQAAVERIATKTSANTTRQGIAEYDKSMPNRIQQINQNPSRR